MSVCEVFLSILSTSGWHCGGTGRNLDMARAGDANGRQPLLKGYEEDFPHGDVEDANWGGEKGEKLDRSTCTPSTSTLVLLEAFDNGPVGVLQSDAQTTLNIVTAT